MANTVIYVHVVTNQVVCNACAEDDPMTGFMKLDAHLKYNAFGSRQVTYSVCGSLR